MPFGISFASEVIQQRNDEKFGSIQNVFAIADNLIVVGKKGAWQGITPITANDKRDDF